MINIENKHSLGYKPNIQYIDEYDSSATLSEEQHQSVVISDIHDPTEDIQDNIDRIDVFLPGIDDDIRNLIEGVYLPLKDYWEEIKDLEYDKVPDYEEIDIIESDMNSSEDDMPEDSEDDNNDDNDSDNNTNNNGNDDDDSDMPPSDVLDDDKIDGLIHIIEIEHPRHVIVQKEYAKNIKDLFGFYTGGLLEAISNYWIQAAPMVMQTSSDKRSYILNNFDSYKTEEGKNISTNKKHMLDYAVRTEILRQQKVAFLQKMFPTDETIIKLRNYKAAQELRKKYAAIDRRKENTKEASDHNAFLDSSNLVYDTKYDNSYKALYKYFNSANKTLSDVFNLSIQEQKAKQYLK